jgi:hypothetical protein
MKTITGGPAFPHEYKYGDGTAHRCDGMTLRDYFAAKAMQGMLAHEYSWPLRIEDLYACDAYVMADAMLKTRELVMLKAGVQK